MTRKCACRFDDRGELCNWDGWTCWDIVAAGYLVRPDLYVDEPLSVTLNERLPSVSYLEKAANDASHAIANAPRVGDAERFRTIAFEVWEHALTRCGKTPEAAQINVCV